ncbi:MAG: type VI secretion system tip protein VgrG [Planctomycetes bacterium]|nr:type VI secretion system tip protein VgrG [Planctomycetota bacterium]
MVLKASTKGGLVFGLGTDAVPSNTLRLVSFEGTEAVSRPYRFDLELISTKADIDSEALIEKPAFLRVKRGLPSKRLFELRIHGALSSFRLCDRQPDRQSNLFFCTAVLVPRFWKLSLSHQNRVFLDKSVLEIVEEVLKENGFEGKDYEFKTVGTYPKREYVVQYAESDLDFVSRLLEHDGLFYIFKQEDDHEKVVFSDDPTAYLPIEIEDTLPYRAGPGPAPVLGPETWFLPEIVPSFSATRSLIPKKVVLRDYNYRTPTTELKVEQEIVPKGFGTVYEYGPNVKTQGEGKSLAKVRAEEWKCREVVYRGASTGRAFGAGSIFKLSEHYRDDFNRKYVLTEVCHHGKQIVSLGGPAPIVAEYRNEFACIPSDQVFRPERQTPKPRMAGATTAWVDDSCDSEYAELDEMGRYHVRLPLDLSGRDKATASHPVRMAQPYAGPDYGIHNPLHKNAEVLLTHVNGDPDRPIIASAVPNPDTASPVVDKNQVQCRWIDPATNEIMFDMTKDAEIVYIHAQKDWHILVENDKAQKIGHDEEAEVVHDRTRKVGNDEKIRIDKNLTESVGVDMSLTVEANMSEDIHKNRQETVGENKTVAIKKDLTETISGEHSHTVVKGLVINAKTINEVAKDEIVLNTGKATIVMKKNGDITIDGKEITITGSGNITMKAKKILEN